MPGFIKNVQEYYLEDILKMTNRVQVLLSEKSTQNSIFLLEKWCIEKRKQSYFKPAETGQTKLANFFDETSENNRNIHDGIIENAWINGNIEYFNYLINLIKRNKMSGINAIYL